LATRPRSRRLPVMKLNHLTLAVPDVPEATAFLEKYFALRSMGGNDKMAGLRDDDGLVLVLARIPKGSEVEYPHGFHVGFLQKTEAEVDEINRRLKDDGFDVPPPARLHGSWAFFFRSPGGFYIEVGC
jgi:lactoylglutathione lyase